jgi:hypothetical protein
MNSPEAWETLGLEQETATESDVKRAYARLLRFHRPEQDPEGFQKVREAREIALRQIEWRDRGAGGRRRGLQEHSAGPVSDPIEKSSAPNDGTAIEDAPYAKRSVTAGEAGRLEDELIALRDGPAARWADRMEDAWRQGREEEVVCLLDEERLIDAIAAEHTGLADLWVQYLLRESDFARAERFGIRLLERHNEIDDLVAGPVFVRLANVIAVRYPDTARAMLNKAFSMIGATWLMRDTEQWVIVGDLLKSLPPELRDRWSRHLRGAEDPDSLSGTEAQTMVEETRRRVDTQWQGFAVLRQVGPTKLRQACTAAFQIQQRAELGRQAARRDRFGQSGSDGEFPVWRILLLLIPLLGLLGRGLNSSSYVPQSRSNPSRYAVPDSSNIQFGPATFPAVTPDPAARLPEKLRPFYDQLKEQGCGRIAPIVSQLPAVEQADALRSLLIAYAHEGELREGEEAMLMAVADRFLKPEDKARVSQLRTQRSFRGMPRRQPPDGVSP